MEARIWLDENIHDLGCVESEEQVQHTFTIRNLGQEDLELGSVRALSCCVSVDVAPENRRLPYGACGQITVKTTAPGRSGDFQIPVIVNSNDRVRPLVELMLRGTVRAVPVTSPSAVEFGQVGPNETRTLSIVLSDVSMELIRDLHIQAAADCVRAEVLGHAPIPNTGAHAGLGAARIGVTVTAGHPSLTDRVLEDTLTFYSAGKAEPILEVPVRAVFLGQFEVTPRAIFCGVLEPGDTVDRTVRILARGVAGRIRSVEAVGEAIAQVSVKEVLPCKSYEVEVRIKATAAGGLVKQALQVYAYGKESPAILIPVYADIVPGQE